MIIVNASHISASSCCYLPPELQNLPRLHPATSWPLPGAQWSFLAIFLQSGLAHICIRLFQISSLVIMYSYSVTSLLQTKNRPAVLSSSTAMKFPHVYMKCIRQNHCHNHCHCFNSKTWLQGRASWVASQYLNYQHEAGQWRTPLWQDLKSNVRKFPETKGTWAKIALATQCSFL